MEYKSPQNIAYRNHNKKTVFLAGSIEMNTAIDWQKEVTEYFKNFLPDYDILNPRREEWDSSWKQDYNNPNFFQQVTWELNALETTDMIIMYFDPNTKSPISLLELGLFARSGKLRVVCPEGFWRKGNIEVTCDYYNVPLYNTLETLYLDITK